MLKLHNNKGVITAVLMLLFLLTAATPSRANLAQRHILDAGINLGWAVAALELRGDRDPAVVDAVAAWLRNATTHIGAAANNFGEPYYSARKRSGNDRVLIQRLAYYAKSTSRKSARGKANYLMNIWSSYRQSFQITYRSTDGKHYKPACDFYMLDAGYHFGRAHIAAWLKDSRARSYQDTAARSFRNAVINGLRVSIDGFSPKQVPDVKKVCCSFGGVDAWNVLPKITRNTPYKTFQSVRPKIQHIASKATVGKGCGDKPKKCYELLGDWCTPYRMRVLADGTVQRIQNGKVTVRGTWKCNERKKRLTVYWPKGVKEIFDLRNGRLMTGNLKTGHYFANRVTGDQRCPGEKRAPSGSGAVQPAPGQPRPQQPAARQPSAKHFWTGTWNTNYGPLFMTQNGNQVTGRFDTVNGSLKGTVSGSVLEGTWFRKTARIKEGRFKFTIKPNGKSFDGLFSYGLQGQLKKRWSGSKIK